MILNIFIFNSDMSHINRKNNYALLSLEGEIKELIDNSHEKKHVIYEK